MEALQCQVCKKKERKGAKTNDKLITFGNLMVDYPICRSCYFRINRETKTVTPAVGDDGASDVSASAVGDDVTQFTSVISPAAVLTRSSRALARPVVITNAIQIIQTHIESCSIHARAEGDAGKKEVATALTKSKEAVDCAKTAKEIKTAASQFEKASNMCTSERTISKLKNGIAKASPVLLTILTDTDLKKSVYQGCRTTSNHDDAAALVISCLNVVLTVRSDRVTIPDGFVPQAFCDIRDDQLRSVIMVGGWSIREARIIFFKQYRNDPDRKKKLYTLIGAITMAFSMNVVTPAEDGDCDDGDMTITDVSDQIPLFLKMYNEGGLTYPSVAVRAWVHSFFQYIDECFDRMSKSSRQIADMKTDYEQRLVDICRNSVNQDDQCQ